MKKLLTLGLWGMALMSHAHPGVGIVKNSKGEIIYTDTERIWKISKDGLKQVIVPNVHTHEIYIDKNDNLYGEHLWYEGEASNKWGHFIWKYDAKGKFSKVVPDTEGFRQQHSFNCDTAGNMYWIEQDKNEGFYLKKTPDGQAKVLGSFPTKDVRWQYCSPQNNFYYVDDNDLYSLPTSGTTFTPKLEAKDLDDVKDNNANKKPNNSIFGLWNDIKGNLYAAVNSKKQVRKITKEGKMKVIYESKLFWAPTGGLIDKAGNLWVLECNKINQVRVVKVKNPQ